MENKTFTTFEVWQYGVLMASASGPRDQAYEEAMDYVRLYSADGTVHVYELTRTYLFSQNVNGVLTLDEQA